MTAIAAAWLPIVRQGRRPVLPGFRLTFGITIVYLCLVVVLPLLALVAKAASVPLAFVWDQLTTHRALSAFRVSFGSAALAAAVDVPLGLLLAWTLTRYRFPGRGLLDALIDLPFALPTAVAGIALSALYVDDGWIGSILSPLGISVAYSTTGITVALAFIGLPFLVRTVQPVLADRDRAAEEAALTLGASVWEIFRRVILPPLIPAILTGAALAFARGVGEYGSVIFIAGNRPGISEILPLLIVTRLEQFDYAGAAMLGVAMLVVSFLMLLAIHALQRRIVTTQDHRRHV